MRLWPFSKPSVPTEQKQSAVRGAIVVSPGQPVWTPRNYAAFSDEAYTKNVVAYQAINKIADAAASVGWVLKRKNTEVTEHPILSLLNRPNPMQSGAQYMRAKIGFFLLAGNGYEERVTVRGEVRELYQLRPDRMKVVPSQDGVPLRYQYEVNGRKIDWEVRRPSMTCDVRHLKAFHPLNDWYGLSSIEAGAFAVDQNNEAMAWIQALLQNSARPSGALQLDKDRDLSDEQFLRVKREIEEHYTGAKNAGRPMLLEGGLSWQAMGLSPQQMEILDTKYSSARDICLALGVPPQLLGIPGDNTYSNYQEARLAFWEDTVIPLLNVITEDWNAWLLADSDVRLEANLDDIPAIVEKRYRVWEMADKSTDLTVNERRELKGYGKISGGDVLLVASSQIPIEDAGLPPEPVNPSADQDLAYGKPKPGQKKPKAADEQE